jgi:hypothetical protein
MYSEVFKRHSALNRKINYISRSENNFLILNYKFWRGFKKSDEITVKTL